MPDTKITALAAITTVAPANDLFPIVDVSDNSMAASGTTKNITVNQLLGAGGTATLASATITGALDAARLNVTGATIPANGMYLVAANKIGFSTNSIQRLNIDAYGNILNSTTTTQDGFVNFNNSIDGGDLGYVGNPRAFISGGATSSLGLRGASSIQFSIGMNLGMTLNSTGLGVGATPTSRLTIGSGSFSTASANTTAMYTAATGLEVLSDSYYFGNRTGGNLVTITSSGNVGVGVAPSAWGSSLKAFELGAKGNALFTTASVVDGLFMVNNAYFDTGYKYAANGYASRYTHYQGAHQWFNAPSGTAGNAITFTQAMTLDASGNLLVGKTAGYGSGESNTLQLKSFLVFAPDNTGSASNRNWINGANGSAAGSLDWTISSANNNWPNFAYRMQLTSAGALNNTTGTYGTISDLRLKDNISDARNYLADLLKLRVVKYSLKEESSAVATKLGFIAQEVEQVFPNLVEKSDKEYEGGEGIRSVKTSVLIPMLLKAIQELTARVEALEA